MKRKTLINENIKLIILIILFLNKAEKGDKIFSNLRGINFFIFSL